MPPRPLPSINSISEGRIRKALAHIKPPADEILLEKELARTLSKLDATLKRSGAISREARDLVDKIGSAAPAVLHTMGGLSSLISVRDRGSVFELLSRLYLPTDDPTPWVPPQRRYFDNQIAVGAVGSASAYKNNGNLTAIQSVDLFASDESTYAGVFIYFKTDLSNYGQVSLVNFQPDIDWTYRDFLDSNPVWTDRVAHLDGFLRFTAYVWLTGYELNIATNKFELLSPPSGISYKLNQSTWWVSELGGGAASGNLRDGAATFKFIASPERIYALGAWIQLRVTHNIKNAQGGSIPNPGPNDFTEYALLKATVPDMWLDHQVLAR